MKAIVLNQPQDVSIQDLPIPEIGDDQCLLKVQVAAICVNDVRDYKGGVKWTYPRIGGHEYSAVIEKVGKNVNPQHFKIGQKVIAFVLEDCGYCDSCKHGHANICDNSTNGPLYYNEGGISGFKGFSQYVAMDARYLYPCPEDANEEELSLTEPLACVLNSIDKANIEMGDDVVVIGGGAMGMLHVLCAKKQGARVILSETDEKRRAFGLELGADVAINPMDSDPVQQVKELTNGRGANVVFNTTAIPAVASQAIEMTAKNGLCNMFSSIHPNEPIPVNAGRLHSQEITVTGTQNGTVKSFAQSIDCISKGIINVRPLIDKIYDFNQAKEALEYASRPDTYKVLMRFAKEESSE